MKAKVCALVVTHNRIDCLKRSIKSLLLQSYPLSSLIIVDNGSTDGTYDHLKSLSLPIDLHIIFQENLGGAGGFKAGLETFTLTDSDWCWLMDDDGWPDRFALEFLDPGNDAGPKWRNSIVLNEENRDELAFGLCIEGICTNRKEIIKNAKTPINTCNPFNGTLLHKQLVTHIGFPIPELFIKGDESEYQRRALRYGYVTETYVNSEFYHPVHREPNIVKLNDSRLWIFYYKVRNIDVFGEKSGEFIFNKHSSYILAKNCSKEILTSFKMKSISYRGAFFRIWIVWSGLLAAFLNYPFRWFIPR